MVSTFIGLGSNVGDREGYLKKAVAALARLKGNKILQTSSIYETEPWGRKNQSYFLNMVVEMGTELDPCALLKCCQKIENKLGRHREDAWGPRIVDIDILLYGESVVHDKDLQIPHPRVAERRFVLVPLGEIASDVFIPGVRKTVREVLGACSDEGSVTLYERLP